MTDQQHTSNDLVTEGFGTYNAIAVSFEDDRNAYNALTLLKELDSQQRVGVREAVVVRGEDGQVIEQDRIESTFLPGTAGGAHRPADRDHRRAARSVDRRGQRALRRLAVRPL
jgi:hypothetical protein